MKSNPNNELIKNLMAMRENSQNEHEIIYLSKIIKGLEDGLISLNWVNRRPYKTFDRMSNLYRGKFLVDICVSYYCYESFLLEKLFCL